MENVMLPHYILVPFLIRFPTNSSVFVFPRLAFNAQCLEFIKYKHSLFRKVCNIWNSSERLQELFRVKLESEHLFASVIRDTVVSCSRVLGGDSQLFSVALLSFPMIMISCRVSVCFWKDCSSSLAITNIFKYFFISKKWDTTSPSGKVWVQGKSLKSICWTMCWGI